MIGSSGRHLPSLAAAYQNRDLIESCPHGPPRTSAQTSQIDSYRVLIKRPLLGQNKGTLLQRVQLLRHVLPFGNCDSSKLFL